MSPESFSGTWIFDSSSSQLKSPPQEWIQVVTLEGSRIHVCEHIARPDGAATVEVDARMNGDFYPVQGSPIVDEIAYTWNEDSIHGTGRKSGTVSLREVLRLLGPDHMTLSMILYLKSNEIPLGTAHFGRRSAAPGLLAL